MSDIQSRLDKLNRYAGTDWIGAGQALNEMEALDGKDDKFLYQKALAMLPHDEQEAIANSRVWNDASQYKDIADQINERKKKLNHYQEVLSLFGDSYSEESKDNLSKYIKNISSAFDAVGPALQNQISYYGGFGDKDTFRAYWKEKDRQDYLMNPNTVQELETKIRQLHHQKFGLEYTPEGASEEDEKRLMQQKLELSEQIRAAEEDLSEAKNVQQIAAWKSDPDFQKYSQYTYIDGQELDRDYAEKNFFAQMGSPANLNELMTGLPGMGKSMTNELVKEYLFGGKNGRRLSSAQLWELMSPDELEIYNYLFQSPEHGKVEAEAYAESLQDELKTRYDQRLLQHNQKTAEEHPVLSSIATVFGTLSLPGEALSDVLAGDMEFESLRRANSSVQTLRGTVAENIKEDHGDVAAFLYNVGMSTADTIAASALTLGNPTAGALIMASSAASSTLADGLDRGLSTDRAIMTALGAGAAEFIFEKVGLGQLKIFKEKGAATLKDALINVVKGMVVEGSEEAATNIANTLTDIMINGDLSQFNQSVQTYIQEGMTEDEAWGRATIDFLGETGLEALAGAISGAVLSGGASTLGNYQYYKVGKRVKSNITNSELQQVGLTFSEGSDTYRMAKSLTNKSGNVKVGKMFMTMMDESYSNARTRVADRLSELGSDAKNADVLLDLANGNRTMQSAELIRNDESFWQAYQEFSKGQHGGETLKKVNRVFRKATTGAKSLADAAERVYNNHGGDNSGTEQRLGLEARTGLQAGENSDGISDAGYREATSGTGGALADSQPGAVGGAAQYRTDAGGEAGNQSEVAATVSGAYSAPGIGREAGAEVARAVSRTGRDGRQLEYRLVENGNYSEQAEGVVQWFAARGIPVDVYAEEDGVTDNGSAWQGAVSGGRIQVNNDMAAPAETVARHETVHLLRTAAPDIYQNLMQSVQDAGINVQNERVRQIIDFYGDSSVDGAVEELAAQMSGVHMYDAALAREYFGDVFCDYGTAVSAIEQAHREFDNRFLNSELQLPKTNDVDTEYMQEATDYADAVQQNLKYAKDEKFWKAENKNDDSTSGEKKKKRRKKNEKIISPGGIVDLTEDLLGIPVANGHFWKNAYGIYKVKAEVIRTKVAYALPTVAHEVGHHFDKKAKLRSLPAITEAIEVLRTTRPDFYKAYKQGAIPGEAVAEFMRDYITDRTLASKKYPEFFKQVQEALQGDMLHKLNQIADATNAYMVSTGAERALAAVLTREKARRMDWHGKRISDAKDALITTFADDAYILKEFKDDSYDLLNYERKTDSRVVNTLVGKYMSGNKGDIAYRRTADGDFMLDENGKKIPEVSLKTLLKDIKKREYRDFRQYLIYCHTLEWIARDKRVFADDTLNKPEFLNSEIERLEEKYPHFKESARGIYEWNRSFLYEWVVDTGMARKEKIQQYLKQYPKYVPLQRNVENNTRGAKRGYANQKAAFRRAKGSGRDILDPLESMAVNLELRMKAASRNDVMLEIANTVDKKGEYGYMMDRIPTDKVLQSVPAYSVKEDVDSVLQLAANQGVISGNAYDELSLAVDAAIGSTVTDWVIKGNQGQDIVWVMKNGERQYYQVHNKRLLQALTSLNPNQYGVIMSLYRTAGTLFKLLNTGRNPIWGLASNAPRDFDAGFKFNTDSHIVKFFKDYVKAAYQTLRKTEEYQRYKASGGGYNNVLSANPKSMKAVMREMVRADESGVKQFLRHLLHPIELIESLTDAIETAPRLAEYNRVLKKTGDARKAMRAADEITLNFTRHGTISRQIDTLYPYFNANVQGLYKLGNTLVHKETLIPFVKKSIASAVILTALQFAFRGLLGDEEEYEKLSAYKKNNFYNFSIGDGKFLSIPKSKDTAVLNSLFERAVEIAVKDDPDFKQEVSDFGDYILSVFVPPGILDPFGDLMIFGTKSELDRNEDFKGTPIVSGYYQDLLPEYQYNEKTSAIAKFLGGAFGYSPMKIDHIISSNFGVLGQLNKALGADDKDYTLGLKNKVITDAAYSNDVLNHFYDRCDTLEATVKSRPDDAESFAEYQQYKSMKSVISALNQYGKEDDARLYKIAARDYALTFTKTKAGITDTRQIALYERTGDKDVFYDSTFSREYTKDKVKYTMPADDYLLYVKEYNEKAKQVYDEILNMGLSDSLTVRMLADAKQEVVDYLDDKYKIGDDEPKDEGTIREEESDWMVEAFKSMRKDAKRSKEENNNEYIKSIVNYLNNQK